MAADTLGRGAACREGAPAPVSDQSAGCTAPDGQGKRHVDSRGNQHWFTRSPCLTCRRAAAWTCDRFAYVISGEHQIPECGAPNVTNRRRKLGFDRFYRLLQRLLLAGDVGFGKRRADGTQLRHLRRSRALIEILPALAARRRIKTGNSLPYQRIIISHFIRSHERQTRAMPSDERRFGRKSWQHNVLIEASKTDTKPIRSTGRRDKVQALATPSRRRGSRRCGPAVYGH